MLERELPRWERETRRRSAPAHGGGHPARGRPPHRRGRAEFADHAPIVDYLAQVEADVVDNAEEMLAAAQPRELPALLAARLDDKALFRRYRVNVLVDNADSIGAPVVFEDRRRSPTWSGAWSTSPSSAPW